jgi:hypothetical protein
MPQEVWSAESSSGNADRGIAQSLHRSNPKWRRLYYF